MELMTRRRLPREVTRSELPVLPWRCGPPWYRVRVQWAPQKALGRYPPTPQIDLIGHHPGRVQSSAEAGEETSTGAGMGWWPGGAGTLASSLAVCLVRGGRYMSGAPRTLARAAWEC